MGLENVIMFVIFQDGHTGEFRVQAVNLKDSFEVIYFYNELVKEGFKERMEGNY